MDSSGDWTAPPRVFFSRRSRSGGDLGWADRGTKPCRQEGDKVLHVLRSVRGVAPPLREGLDSVRTGGGVVDRAEHEMKAPKHFVARELGQAFAKRVDKLGARGVEILGDKLVEQFGVFRGQNGT